MPRVRSGGPFRLSDEYQPDVTYPPPRYPQQPEQTPGSGQPYSPPAGYGYPPQPQAPKRRKWPWIVGGIVLACILGCVGLFTLVLDGTAKVASNLDDNQKGKNALAGRMNTASTDGKFQFTVTRMQCGLGSVGPDDFGQKAQGQFCLVSVQVKNVGKSAEVFNDFTQRAYDADGTEFSPDSGAGVLVNKESSTFLESINPGNTVKGKLVFDVPKGAKLASVLLHESEFTAGVKVPLR
jgi:hypothetical protein